MMMLKIQKMKMKLNSQKTVKQEICHFLEESIYRNIRQKRLASTFYDVRFGILGSPKANMSAIKQLRYDIDDYMAGRL